MKTLVTFSSKDGDSFQIELRAIAYTWKNAAQEEKKDFILGIELLRHLQKIANNFFDGHAKNNMNNFLLNANKYVITSASEWPQLAKTIRQKQTNSSLSQLKFEVVFHDNETNERIVVKFGNSQYMESQDALNSKGDSYEELAFKLTGISLIRPTECPYSQINLGRWDHLLAEDIANIMCGGKPKYYTVEKQLLYEAVALWFGLEPARHEGAQWLGLLQLDLIANQAAYGRAHDSPDWHNSQGGDEGGKRKPFLWRNLMDAMKLVNPQGWVYKKVKSLPEMYIAPNAKIEYDVVKKTINNPDAYWRGTAMPYGPVSVVETDIKYMELVKQWSELYQELKKLKREKSDGNDEKIKATKVAMDKILTKMKSDIGKHAGFGGGQSSVSPKHSEMHRLMETGATKMLNYTKLHAPTSRTMYEIGRELLLLPGEFKNHLQDDYGNKHNDRVNMLIAVLEHPDFVVDNEKELTEVKKYLDKIKSHRVLLKDISSVIHWVEENLLSDLELQLQTDKPDAEGRHEVFTKLLELIGEAFLERLIATYQNNRIYQYSNADTSNWEADEWLGLGADAFANNFNFNLELKNSFYENKLSSYQYTDENINKLIMPYSSENITVLKCALVDELSKKLEEGFKDKLTLIPMNISYDNQVAMEVGHWVLLAIQPDKHTGTLVVRYFDSIEVITDNEGKAVQGTLNVPENVQEIIKQTFSDPNYSGVYPNIDIKKIDLKQQVNSVDCGPIVVSNVIDIARGTVDLNMGNNFSIVEPDQNQIDELRMLHLQIVDNRDEQIAWVMSHPKGETKIDNSKDDINFVAWLLTQNEDTLSLMAAEIERYAIIFAIINANAGGGSFEHLPKTNNSVVDEIANLIKLVNPDMLPHLHKELIVGNGEEINKLRELASTYYTILSKYNAQISDVLQKINMSLMEEHGSLNYDDLPNIKDENYLEKLNQFFYENKEKYPTSFNKFLQLYPLISELESTEKKFKEFCSNSNVIKNYITTYYKKGSTGPDFLPAELLEAFVPSDITTPQSIYNSTYQKNELQQGGGGTKRKVDDYKSSDSSEEELKSKSKYLDYKSLPKKSGWGIPTTLSEGATLLRKSIITDTINEIAELIESGTVKDINEADDKGNTILHFAVENDLSSRIIKLLLDQGADPEQQNKQGNTAMHLAVIHQNLDAVDIFRKNDVDCEIENKDGKTAIQLARKSTSDYIRAAFNLLDNSSDESSEEDSTPSSDSDTTDTPRHGR